MSRASNRNESGVSVTRLKVFTPKPLLALIGGDLEKGCEGEAWPMCSMSCG
jgi:hypothetical protein